MAGGFVPVKNNSTRLPCVYYLQPSSDNATSSKILGCIEPCPPISFEVISVRISALTHGWQMSRKDMTILTRFR